MKQLLFFLFTLLGFTGFSQNFSTDISTAKTAYAAGKLDDAHFALMQAMQEIDMIIGKKIISFLPQKMDAYTANTKDDEVTSNIGFIGNTIQRNYGPNDEVELSIISNSPLVGSLNTLLNTPLLGGIMTNGNNKIIKVQGYKAQLSKDVEEGNTGKVNYTIQIPLGSSLVTFNAKNTTESQATAWINNIPFAEIAKLIK